jgi:Fic family protein
MTYVWQQDSWPELFWQHEQLLNALGQARLAQGKLLSKVQALGIELSREAQAEILTEETITTSAIEGEIFDRDSVRSSVARRLGLPFAGLPQPARQIDGLVEVLLDAASQFDTSLTAERLKGWQAALFPTGYSGFSRIHVGEWRQPGPMRVVSGPLGHEKTHFKAPPHERVEKEMLAFLDWWEKSRVKTEGLLRAGIAHFRFVTIHPFDDGNGRIARALVEKALAQDEGSEKRFYSLSRQIMAERNGYYDALEDCQKGNGDITRWLLWFLECMVRAITNSETLIAGTLTKSEFWQRNALVHLSPQQRKVVNRLLDAEPEGFDGGMTTRKYVSIAKVSRATAYREILDLVNKGILEANPGKGRNTSYRLVL